MITKGTEEYKKAQKIANSIMNTANLDRWHNNSSYLLLQDGFWAFIHDMTKVEGFAAQVATTIYNSCKAFSRKLAYVSSKQAWILACAAVENNIDY